MCIEGEFEIIYNKTDYMSVSIGETILIPAILNKILIKPKVKSKILEIYI